MRLEILNEEKKKILEHIKHNFDDLNSIKIIN